MARIGIFGGTFNPVHTGHVRLCRQCMKSLQLDSMLVIPAKIPPHKDAPALAPDNDRIAMLKRAFAGLPVTVSDIECRLSGKSYTVRTLRLLKEQYPDDDFYLLIGSDMLYTFEQWREYETILSLAQVVAGARHEDEYHALCEKKESFGALSDRKRDCISRFQKRPFAPMSRPRGRRCAISAFIIRSVSQGLRGSLQHVTARTCRKQGQLAFCTILQRKCRLPIS